VGPSENPKAKGMKNMFQQTRIANPTATTA
jgi:hypothetical protein